jgi:metal-responsive CopG/Arc/MetJ family transcriptional regulator
LVASVPESLVAGLDMLAESEGWNRSRAVTEAIRGLLKRKKRA